MDPLQMDDILPFILQHVDADSLKNCRLVSKFWSKIAAKELFRAHFLRLPSNFLQKFQKNWDWPALKLEIVQIKEFLEKVGNVPNILISDENLEFDFFLLKRLNIRWTKIKHLKLDWRLHLKFEVYENFLDEIKRLCGPHHLNFLEIPSQVLGENRLLGVKIATAVLEFCLFMTPGSPNTFTVSHLSIFAWWQKDAEKLEKLLQPNSPVRILNLHLNLSCSYNLQIRGSIITILEKFLEVNKNHLKSLQINDRDTGVLPPNLQIPKMPHLELFHLTCNSDSQLSFHPNFQFSSHFPVLQEVHIVLDNTYRPTAIWQNFFNGRIEPAKSVKKLRVDSVHELNRRIFETFPEIEELRLNDTIVRWMGSGLMEMTSSLCTKLRRLRIDQDSNLNIIDYARIAATLSGFPKRAVQKILFDWEEVEDTDIPEEVDSSRRKSLLDFPDLEELHLYCKSEWCDSDSSLKFMEFLQHRVFSFMPKLLHVKRVK